MLQRLLMFVLLTTCSSVWAGSDVDPWEGFNRRVYTFNDFLDRNLLLPVTRIYVAVTPQPIRTGVHNVFGNLEDVVSLVSNVLQLKLHNSAQDFARVVGNTLFGVLGIFDVATPLGLPKQREEFGQVLGYWGVPAGPYLMLPFLGPSSVRDGISVYPNSLLAPTSALEQNGTYWGVRALEVVDTRAGLIQAESLVSGDRYSFIRDAYMQRREFLVNDGVASDGFEDDGF
ncbi:MAG: VacJ family lipoprotein [Motiliproteus sp.]